MPEDEVKAIDNAFSESHPWFSQLEPELKHALSASFACALSNNSQLAEYFNNKEARLLD